MESLQQTVTVLDVSIDLIHEIQADMALLKDKVVEMGNNMNVMQKSLH